MEKRTKGIFANPVTDIFWISKEKNRVWELEDGLTSKVILLPTLTCSLVRQSLANIVTQLPSLALLLDIFQFLLTHDTCTLNLNVFTISTYSVSLDPCQLIISDTWLLYLFQYQPSSPTGTLFVFRTQVLQGRESDWVFFSHHFVWVEFSCQISHGLLLADR